MERSLLSFLDAILQILDACSFLQTHHDTSAVELAVKNT